VPGATVTVHPSGFPQYAPPVSATTDAAGAYALDFKATPSPVLSIGWAVAERPGHERFYRYLPPALSQEMVQNFHLYRIKRITAGETVSIVVRPDDTSCGDSDEWVCRTVRVGAGMTGRVILTLTSREASTDSGLCAVQDRPPYTYRCNSSELVYDMTAGGADLIVTIFMDWRAKESQSFTLRTAFVPYAPRLF
jgi:hypothetical protein